MKQWLLFICKLNINIQTIKILHSILYNTKNNPTLYYSLDKATNNSNNNCYKNSYNQYSHSINNNCDKNITVNTIIYFFN